MMRVAIPPTDEVRRREGLAERVAATLDVPVTVAGVVFVAIVVADNLTPASAPWKPLWVYSTWLLWVLFVVEFIARAVIAPSTAKFLARNWWQLAFLAVPFLRFMRSFTRAARLARIASTSVRTKRSAERTLAGRIGGVAGVSVAAIFSATELLFEFGSDVGYAATLHAVALGAISGEPLGLDSGLADVLDVLLALHATVVFAALAGTVGAFFLERRPLPDEIE